MSEVKSLHGIFRERANKSGCVRGVKMDIEKQHARVGAFRCNGVGDALALLQRLDSYLQ